MSESNRRSAFPVYLTMTGMVKYLSDEQAGKLFKAMLNYASTRTAPDLGNDPALNMAFDFFKECDDENLKKWGVTREKRKAAAETRWKTEREKNGEEAFLTASPEDLGLPFK